MLVHAAVVVVVVVCATILALSHVLDAQATTAVFVGALTFAGVNSTRRA